MRQICTVIWQDLCSMWPVLCRSDIALCSKPSKMKGRSPRITRSKVYVFLKLWRGEFHNVAERGMQWGLYTTTFPEGNARALTFQRLDSEEVAGMPECFVMKCTKIGLIMQWKEALVGVQDLCAGGGLGSSNGRAGCVPWRRVACACILQVLCGCMTMPMSWLRPTMKRFQIRHGKWIFRGHAEV